MIDRDAFLLFYLDRRQSWECVDFFELYWQVFELTVLLALTFRGPFVAIDRAQHTVECAALLALLSLVAGLVRVG